MIPIYEQVHFREKDGKKIPSRLSIFAESGKIEKGYAREGTLMICIQGDKDRSCFKLSISESCGLKEALNTANTKLLRSNMELLYKAAGQRQEQRGAESP